MWNLCLCTFFCGAFVVSVVHEAQRPPVTRGPFFILLFAMTGGVNRKIKIEESRLAYWLTAQ